MNFTLGFLSLPWWGYVIVTLLLTHVTIASVTIFLHRHQAHRALELHPALSHFFRCWLWLTTGMITKEWVAIHRKHHSTCETEKDPHSPQHYGLMHVLFGGVFLYVKESFNKDTLSRYGNGTPDDWIERHVYTPYHKLGVALLFFVQLFLFGPIVGPLIWLVQMIWIPFFAAGVINGVGHFLGYRNADTPDASHNILPWGILIGGEELHNNHHAFPYSAKLALRPFPIECDIGWFYIKLLAFLGLAEVKMLPPQFATARCRIDSETIAFLRRDKGRVRYLYRKLLLRVVKSELPHATGDVRIHLEEMRDTLASATWKYDVLPSACSSIAALSGSQSLLPSLGKFAELLLSIQTSHREVVTSPEREASLVHELDFWCQCMIAEGPPRCARFARMLMGSYMVRPLS